MVAFNELTPDEWEAAGKPTPAQYERQAAALAAKRAELAAVLKAEVRAAETEKRAAREAANPYGKPDAENPYGRYGVIGGGSAPGPIAVTPEQKDAKFVRDFAQQFNGAARNRYGERQSISTADVDRYTTLRFVDHLRGEIARFAGYHLR